MHRVVVRAMSCSEITVLVLVVVQLGSKRNLHVWPN